MLTIDERIVIQDGERDSRNKYPFTVAIKAERAGEVAKCSGVLMGPRLVVTAGYCVCMRRRATAPEGEGGSIIDSSTCADHATVETVTYQPAEMDTGLPESTTVKRYTGKVRPHPDLKVLLDEQALVTSSNADLAVIVLDVPVKGSFPSVHLADSEVEIGDSFLMVGYGYDALIDVIHGVRRSGEKRVTRLPDAGGGGALFEQEGTRAFTAGSGDPCLRKEKRGMALVGIATKTLDGQPAFTSAYFHRQWLLSELQRVLGGGPAEDSKQP